MGLAVIFALVSALSYGVSDFLGGTAATRLRVIPTTVLSYGAATVTLATLVLATGGVWSQPTVFWGAIAGVGAVVGFVTFYAAMAVGPMSLVSPLIAVLGSAVPVVASVFLGEVLSWVAWIGVALALVSAVLISSQPREGGRRLSARAAILSTVAGLCLGSSVIALDRVPADSGSIAGLVEIVVGLVLLAVVIAFSRAVSPIRLFLRDVGGTEVVEGSRSRSVAAALVAGVLLGAANASVIAALQAGSLAVVSVLVGLYPLATLLLARLVGGERMTRLQLTGAGLAIAACSLLGLALGGAS
jgi:drug/metabolite transporter (DMT)-like permease